MIRETKEVMIAFGRFSFNINKWGGRCDYSPIDSVESRAWRSLKKASDAFSCLTYDV